jgi:ATP-dependent Clp protease ATP-binding subunit ClpA
MQLANQEAQRFNHEYISTEHILLGLVEEGCGVAAEVLNNLGIELRKIRLEVERVIQPGPDVWTGKLPPTTRAKNVIEYAIDEARKLKHNHVGTEHLLLGLPREREGVAAHVLMNLLVDAEKVRLALRGVVVHQDVPPPAETPQDLPAETLQAVRELEAQIKSLNAEKEAAVAGCDFERAAYLRDQEDKLKRQRVALIRERLKGAGKESNRDNS